MDWRRTANPILMGSIPIICSRIKLKVSDYLGLFNWIKNVLDFSVKVSLDKDKDKEEEFNYYLVKYDANYCGIGESFVLKTDSSKTYVSIQWGEWCQEDAYNYYSEDDDEDELEVYTDVEEISKEKYLKLKKEDGYKDWIL